MFPLIQNGKVVDLAAAVFEVNSALVWGAPQDGVQVGDIFDGTTYSRPVLPPTPLAGPRYVPLSTIRDRVTAASKWAEFAAALDSLPADKRWHLLTLTEGVASDDADAIALLTAVGCNPTVILA